MGEATPIGIQMTGMYLQFFRKRFNSAVIVQYDKPTLLQKLLLRRALNNHFSPEQTSLTCQRLSTKTEIGACKETSSGPTKTKKYHSGQFAFCVPN